jgi:hypothetical protein
MQASCLKGYLLGAYGSWGCCLLPLDDKYCTVGGNTTNKGSTHIELLRSGWSLLPVAPDVQWGIFIVGFFPIHGSNAIRTRSGGEIYEVNTPPHVSPLSLAPGGIVASG